MWNWSYNHHDEIRAAADTIDVAGASKAVKGFLRDIHLTLKQAESDFDRMQFNTVVSAAMKMMNSIDGFAETSETASAARKHAISILIRTLYPIAPHITSALWDDLGFAEAEGTELIDAPWPEVNESALEVDEVKYVIQVNGKLRGQIMIPTEASREDIEKTVLAHPDVQRFVGDATVRKVIVVPNKLVNVVAK